MVGKLRPPAENIFAVQDEIAGAIVEALKLELDIATETASRTTDIEACDHYLRGRQLAREPTRSGLLRAIELYERVIAVDPEFARLRRHCRRLGLAGRLRRVQIGRGLPEGRAPGASLPVARPASGPVLAPAW